MKKSLLQRILITLTLLFGAMSAASATDRLFVDATYIEPGETRTLTLSLENEALYYGFQADINLPKGLEFVEENGTAEIRLSARMNSSYAIVTNLLNRGSLRVGAFSSTHSPIAGNSGTLVSVNVVADDEFAGGELSLTNIHFAGENDRNVPLADFTIDIRNRPINNSYLPDFTIAVGQTKTVSIILDNETPFTALQTDIYLPEGLAIVADSFKATPRMANHTLSAKSFSDGRTRLTSFSPDNTEISAGSGAIIEFDIIATQSTGTAVPIELKNQLFSTSAAHEFLLSNSTSSVTVVQLVSSISISETKISMKIGEQTAITADALPADATNPVLRWYSENESIATVEDGIVTAVGAGTTYIVVESTDGSNIIEKCEIDVGDLSGIDSISSEKVNVSIANRMINIANVPANQTAYIFGIDGSLMKSERSTGNTITFQPSANGIYIIMIDTQRYKVVVR